MFSCRIDECEINKLNQFGKVSFASKKIKNSSSELGENESSM